jgi:hypothetical protein
MLTLGIGRGTVGGGGTGKNLAFGGQRGVYLQADDNFPFHINDSLLPVSILLRFSKDQNNHKRTKGYQPS